MIIDKEQERTVLLDVAFPSDGDFKEGISKMGKVTKVKKKW